MKEALSVNHTTSSSFLTVTITPVTSVDPSGSPSEVKDVCKNTRVTFLAIYVTVTVWTPTTTKTYSSWLRKSWTLLAMSFGSTLAKWHWRLITSYAMVMFKTEKTVKMNDFITTRVFLSREFEKRACFGIHDTVIVCLPLPPNCNKLIPYTINQFSSVQTHTRTCTHTF